jgi:hypothetical protein
MTRGAAVSLGKNLDGLARIIADPNAAPIFQRTARAPANSREAQVLVGRLAIQSGGAAGAHANAAIGKLTEKGGRPRS